MQKYIVFVALLLSGCSAVDSSCYVAFAGMPLYAVEELHCRHGYKPPR